MILGDKRFWYYAVVTSGLVTGDPSLMPTLQPSRAETHYSESHQGYSSTISVLNVPLVLMKTYKST